MPSIPVQRLVFPLKTEVAPLYLRAEAGDGAGRVLAAAELPRWQRRALEVPVGTAAVLDTLFNHLSEAYWARHSVVSAFAFTAEVAGRGEIQLWRRGVDGGNTLLAVHRFHQPDFEPIRLESACRDGQAGVLFLRVRAVEGPVSLRSGVWMALGGIPAPVRLVAGYCTFHREAQVLTNLRAILADAEVCAALDSLVVVDQGRSTALAAAMVDFPMVRLIQQDNLGGSGGFTRVMLEALERVGATHVLLLDDDAEMEPESILRAAAFLSLSPGKALGGQMLDAVAPTRIFEQGSSLVAETLTFRRGNGDLVPVGPQGITPFARVLSTQWNGWWFFAVPLAAVREAGLPLPLFLRYDDVEYGTRLLAQGVETVGLPGVAVWHEPFYLNPGGWQGYFDARNFLAAASIHHGLSRRRALRHVLRSVLGALLTYDYYRAWLYCRGVADWLDGPRSLEADPTRRLEHLRRMAVRFREAEVAEDMVDRDHRSAIAPPPGPKGQVGVLVWLCLRTLAGRESRRQVSPPALSSQSANWWVLSHFTEVAVEPVVPGRFGGWTRLRRSPRLFRSAVARLAVLAIRIALHGRRAAGLWRAAAPDLSSPTHWRRRLAIRP